MAASSSNLPSQPASGQHQRRIYLVYKYDNLAQRVQQYNREVASRTQNEQQREHTFVNEWNITAAEANVAGYNAVQGTSYAIEHWAKCMSYDFCDKCNSLLHCKMWPTFFNMQRRKSKVMCDCRVQNSRYTVPTYNSIPEPLKNLSISDIHALRPFELDCGPYNRQVHGYRVKTGTIKLVISEKSVNEKIANLSHQEDQTRCMNAYRFLMANNDSSYSNFVHLRQQLLQDDSTLNIFNFENTRGIESALWPNLYPYTMWCESSLSGSKLSSKIAFMKKMFSEIIDYGMHFDLLQFQYDRSLFRIISGAINSARVLNCSPARALDTKTFSTTYWQWQHRYLLDAVSQFGLPDVFITISPYEWSFPFANWLDNIRQITGLGPTQLSSFETVNITHVLEQLVRGYLCGSNDNRWTKHIFSYNRIRSMTNVKTYFYRFEFQQRGTAHLHLLVWLHDITKTQHNLFRADIPRSNPHLAYLVHKLQSSDKPSHSLRFLPGESFFEYKDGKQILHLKHPAEEFALNLRAYIATILPALKCSMDFQTTDGVGMLLRYVTSYVSKWQDAITADSLYSYNLEGRQAAIRYLLSLSPAEPEMCLFLSSTKIAWSSSRTKRFTVPTSDTVFENAVAQKYWKRDKCHESLSILQWLRLVDHAKSKPKEYTHGNTLVGTKLVSVFNVEFFFQHTFLNKAHTNFQAICHPRHDQLPQRLRYFAAALHHFPELWGHQDTIREHFTTQGNKTIYVETILSYIQSLRDMLFLTNMQIINVSQLQNCPFRQTEHDALDAQQEAIKHHIIAAANARIQYYQHHDFQYHELEDIDTDADSDSQMTHDNFPVPVNFGTDGNIQWQKPVLVTGKPGSGKSHTILSTVHYLVERHFAILIASPTGFLSSVFKANVSDAVDCDTVHAAFKIPVHPDDNFTTNWSLSRFHVVIIDELSMISNENFEHIMSTIDRLIYRPVLVFCGDDKQQQPFSKVGHRTIPVTNPFKNVRFVTSAYHFNLTIQHRIDDEPYLQFLNHIRNWPPSESLLNDIQHGRVISLDGTITKDHILQVYNLHAENTILTFTKNASNMINDLVCNGLFQNEQHLAIIQFDDDCEPRKIFKGLRVTITQNRDKPNNIVNGQCATIHIVQNTTVVLKLNINNKLVPIHPVTFCRDNRQITAYPIRLAYATTICKAQGQTLPKVVLWFDIDEIPPGTAYVAMSRVKRKDDIYFLKSLKPHYFKPIV